MKWQIRSLQAVLGSRHEAERFDHLSDEEAQEQLRKLAQQHDTNNDGFVDKEELREWIVARYCSSDCCFIRISYVQLQETGRGGGG